MLLSQCGGSGVDTLGFGGPTCHKSGHQQPWHGLGLLRLSLCHHHLQPCPGLVSLSLRDNLTKVGIQSLATVRLIMLGMVMARLLAKAEVIMGINRLPNKAGDAGQAGEARQASMKLSMMLQLLMMHGLQPRLEKHWPRAKLMMQGLGRGLQPGLLLRLSKHLKLQQLL